MKLKCTLWCSHKLIAFLCAALQRERREKGPSQNYRHVRSNGCFIIKTFL